MTVEPNRCARAKEQPPLEIYPEIQNEYYSKENFEVTDQAWDLLHGAYDLHVHATPTVGPMGDDGLTGGFILDVVELVREYDEAGLAGVCIKNHEFGSFFEAQLLNKYVAKSIKVYGGMTLGLTWGGLNPYAVEGAAKANAKIVWFPTFFSRHEKDIWITECPYQLSDPEMTEGAMEYKGNGIYLFDEEGNLKPEVYDILEIIRDNDMCVASAHLSPREALALFEAGHDMGLKKMIATHIEWRTIMAPLALQQRFAELGVKMEKSFYEFNLARAMRSFEVLGPENFIFSSDQGMFPNLRAKRGFACMVQEYLNAGITPEQARIMLHDNQQFLMEG